MDWPIITVLVLAGLIMIGIEFYVPGFVLGSIGGILLLVALGGCYKSYGGYATFLLLIGEVILGIIVSFIAIKYVPSSPLGKKMILAEDQSDVVSQSIKNQDLIGKVGVAHTTLRPSGAVTIDDKRLDAVAESGMIKQGATIKVVAIDENRIIVRTI